MSQESNGAVRQPPDRNWEVAGICAALVALVWCVFGQTGRFEFINFDDIFLSQTPEVAKGLTPGGILWAFTHTEVCCWIPLTTLSHMMDCQLYGMWAGGHHLTNVLLHSAAAVLLFLMLREMTGVVWRSAYVAALFAIHPLRVESVAWVIERKDVLSGIFFMLTLRAYTRYARRPASKGNYTMALVWFALGLMSKPMLVTVPFVLILLDYWPLGLWQKRSELPGLLKEKLPFFAFSMVASVGEIVAAKQAIEPTGEIPVLPRLANAAVAYVTYIGKLVHPSRLAVFYPLPEEGWGAWKVIGACLVLTAFSVGAWVLRRKQPYLLVGWFWYLGMLVPVIGILQTGLQAYADRFTYLPQIGLCLAGTWAAADWAERYPRRRGTIMGVAAAVLALLLATAIRQTTYWRDSVTLWTHSFGCTDDNALTRFTLGDALDEQGRTGEAIAEYREALRFNPAYVDAHVNLGLALDKLGRTQEAIAQYREASRINTGNGANSHLDLGNALARQVRTEEAIAEYREALRINPDIAEAHYDLGKALAQQRRTAEAITEYREALRINPDYADAHNNLGIALAQQGQIEESIAHMEKALELQPSNLSHQNNLAWMLATAPQVSLRNGPKALELAMKANRATQGGNPNIAQTLAAAYAETGEFPDAVRTAQQALQMAEDRSNVPLADELRRELELYKAGRRFESAR